MPSKLAKILLPLSVFLPVSLAQAGPIIGGLEWFQPRDLLGNSWNDFNAVCPGGPCVGSVGTEGPDITGWNWASVDEVNELFNNIIEGERGTRPLGPGPSSYREPGLALGSAFFEFFDISFMDGSSSFSADFIWAFTREEKPGIPNDGLIGTLSKNQNFDALTSEGQLPRSSAAGTAFHRPKWSTFGAWLYRPAEEVPVPATWLLFMSGLMALLLRTKWPKAGSLAVEERALSKPDHPE